MPMMNLTYPEGAFGAAGTDELADSLTGALLRAERAPDTEFFRSITWVYTHEMPAGSIYTSGKPIEQPIFRLDVTTPEGALSERRRKEMVEEATKLIMSAAGIDDPMRVWVLLHEVPEGQWGAAGQIIQFQQLLAAAKAERESAGAGAEAVTA